MTDLIDKLSKLSRQRPDRKLRILPRRSVLIGTSSSLALYSPLREGQAGHRHSLQMVSIDCVRGRKAGSLENAEPEKVDAPLARLCRYYRDRRKLKTPARRNLVIDAAQAGRATWLSCWFFSRFRTLTRCPALGTGVRSALSGTTKTISPSREQSALLCLAAVAVAVPDSGMPAPSCLGILSSSFALLFRTQCRPVVPGDLPHGPAEYFRLARALDISIQGGLSHLRFTEQREVPASVRD